jgi:hypothetical protein
VVVVEVVVAVEVEEEVEEDSAPPPLPQPCKAPITSVIHGMVSYAGDIDNLVKKLSAMAEENVLCNIKHMLMWDHEGSRPFGLPPGINLDVIPHPPNIVTDLMPGYKFAQVKFFALLLETAKRMDGDSNIKHLALTDSDSIIYFPVMVDTLEKYMPNGLYIGGAFHDQVIEGGYVGSGFSFYTRDLVFAIRAYVMSHVGFFPLSYFFLKKRAPLSNFDVSISSLSRSLGGVLVQLPGAYSQNALCAYPRGYLQWPILATQGLFTNVRQEVPQIREVLRFMSSESLLA